MSEPRPTLNERLTAILAITPLRIVNALGREGIEHITQTRETVGPAWNGFWQARWTDDAARGRQALQRCMPAFLMTMTDAELDDAPTLREMMAKANRARSLDIWSEQEDEL